METDDDQIAKVMSEDQQTRHAHLKIPELWALIKFRLVAQ